MIAIKCGCGNSYCHTRIEIDKNEIRLYDKEDNMSLMYYDANSLLKAISVFKKIFVSLIDEE